jgi:hypothetical protein
MLYRMIEEESFDAIVKRLAQDKAYRSLTERLGRRTVDEEILDRLIVYARPAEHDGPGDGAQSLTDAGCPGGAIAPA